jgi:general secretion pathway protein G
VLKHIKDSQEWQEQSIGAKGFTLIELLVVIVILGILAAVVVFAVSGINDRGQKAACQTEDATVHTAIEAYFAEWSAYPTAAQATASPSVLVTGGFLQKDPTLVTYGGGNSLTGWAGACTGTNAPSGLGNP